LLQDDNYLMARKISKWKRKVMRGWDSIEILSVQLPDSTQKPLMLGESFKAEIQISLNELSGVELGIEILFGQKVNDEVKEPSFVFDMIAEKSGNDLLTFKCDIPLDTAGVYDYAFRMYPKNKDLPHRQDFSLVRWI
jgi:hypothetical protein